MLSSETAKTSRNLAKSTATEVINDPECDGQFNHDTLKELPFGAIVTDSVEAAVGQAGPLVADQAWAVIATDSNVISNSGCSLGNSHVFQQSRSENHVHEKQTMT